MAATILPEIPMTNAGTYYVNGLQLSNDATTPLLVLDVAAGAARDSTNVNDIILSAATTVNINNKGVGGLDFGTIAASTMYAVYVIGSSTNPAVQINVGQPSQTTFSAYPTAAIISTNFSQPSLPLNYDMYRRIGTIVTDSSTHILEFRQVPTGQARAMFYGAAVNVVTAGHATGYTAVSLNVNAPAVPTGVATTVYLAVSLTPTTAGDEVFFQPTGAAAGSTYAALSGVVAAVAQVAGVSCVCNASASISYKLTAAGDAVTYAVQGFVDLL